MLRMTGIGKSFLGVRVLGGVDLEVSAGEVHAVVGENGAGKSTLMKILAGVHAPDEGTIEIDGRSVAFGHPVEAQRAGVAIIYQELTLLPERTVAENVFLGREPVRRGLVDRAAMETATGELLKSLGEESFGPRDLVRRLSVARQQVVEIAKALSLNARIVVMDEPTAPLADHEVELLYTLVRRLTARGIAVLYVSHRLREIFDLADRITVLKDGALVTTTEASSLDTAGLVRLMVGRELDSYYPPRAADPPGEVLLSVRGGGNARLRDIDLDLRAGEIVGVAGLQGSGRTELAKALFGAEPFTTGEMTPRRPRSVREAIAAGIGLVTEDRKAEGLLLNQRVRDNALLVARATGAPQPRTGVERLLERVRLSPPRPAQEVRLLSGGNQQKVVLAKWMTVAPRVLLFDEPSRGVDVGAKAAIHDLMRELARDGMAILMISSELPELIGMSDRIVVLRDGRLAGELPAGSTEEAVMSLAAAS
ncbi:sugar ABC transporter ATP-binding protein [Microbispora cellulosiformans]|uniref:Sugar ABC transporter ATP-binding protein n=2 Tax=Microbispora cellulosiformans TaxID=2614688 RepID=A0A5J5JVP0_9ACTN|nr:sugar ABC transporter ATP-binding protein [Microbispora cellulosiformans]